MAIKMSKRKKKRFEQVSYLLCLVLLGLVVLAYPLKSFAADKNDPLGFVVQAVRPDTQIETDKTYFFIETKPNISQKLKIKIKSTKKEPVKVKLDVTNGVTNESGEIEYISETDELDESLTNPLTDFVEFPEDEITVENFEEKIVEVVVTPPTESYEGIKLGALVFKLIDEEESKEKKVVANEYEFRVGLITSESDAEYKDAKALDLIDGKFVLRNGKKQVVGIIQNPEPKIAENLKVIGSVRKKGSENVLKSKIVENARMAPNSQFNFNIDWGMDKVEPGEYTLKIQASNDEESWEWTKDLAISQDKAKKMNEDTVYRVVLPKWVPIVVVVVLGVIVIITAVLLIRSSRWQEMIKAKARSKKKRSRRSKRRKRED